MQSEVNGTYTKVANLTHGSRPVYQRANATTMYLFYRPRSSDWRIGSNFTSGTSVVASQSEAALCPDQSTRWFAWSGDARVDKDVAVDPARSLGHSLPPAPPARPHERNFADQLLPKRHRRGESESESPTRIPVPPIPDLAGNRGGNPRFPIRPESGIGVPIRRAGDFLVCFYRLDIQTLAPRAGPSGY